MSCQSELSTWYLDDGSLDGSPDSVLADLQRVKDMTSELGLQINPVKCEVFFTNKDDVQANQATLRKLQVMLPGLELIIDTLSKD